MKTVIYHLFVNFSVLNFGLNPNIDGSLCCFVTTSCEFLESWVPKSRGKQMKLGVYFSRTPVNFHAVFFLVRICKLVSFSPFCACFVGFSFMLRPS